MIGGIGSAGDEYRSAYASFSKSSSWAPKRATRSASAVTTEYTTDHSPGRITVIRVDGPNRSCRKSRCEGSTSVLIAKAQFPETFVADAEVVRDLVDDGVAHDLGLPPRGCADPLDGAAEDADPIGQIRLHGAAIRERYALVQTEELAVAAALFGRGLVLDDDLDVAHLLAEFRGQFVEGARDQSRETGLTKS